MPEQIRGFDFDGKHVSAMKVKDMQIYDTPFLSASIQLFNMWMRFKVLPNGKGFAQERQTVLDILNILANESDRWDEWEREKER